MQSQADAERKVLQRLLATPPDPKVKKGEKASPGKKRGRPPKAPANPKPSGGGASG
jgi:hypothetical protein